MQIVTKRRLLFLVLYSFSIFVLCRMLLISLVGGTRTPFKNIAKSRKLFESSLQAVEELHPTEVTSSAPTCTPQHHIMFLKTHKCASSTLQNIFFRYGVLQSLVFALPASDNYFGHPALFQANMVPREFIGYQGLVDVFAIHSRLNVPELLKVLHNDTKFLTVVREPGAQFESLYEFYDFKSLTGHSLENFLELPLEKQRSYSTGNGRIGSNSMLFDMGVDFNATPTAVEVQRAVQRIDQAFDLVMVVEKVDESLILLKELFCWEYEDILISTKKSRNESSKVTMSDHNLRKVRELNSGDVHLYNHFLEKHNKAVLQYGKEKMEKEVALMRTLRKEVEQDCETRALGNALKNNYWLKEQLKADTTNKRDDIKREVTCWMLLQKEFLLVDSIRNLQTGNVKFIKPMNTSSRNI